MGICKSMILHCMCIDKHIKWSEVLPLRKLLSLSYFYMPLLCIYIQNMEESLPNTLVECVCVFCIKQFVGGKLYQSSFHQFVVVFSLFLLLFWGGFVSDCRLSSYWGHQIGVSSYRCHLQSSKQSNRRILLFMKNMMRFYCYFSYWTHIFYPNFPVFSVDHLKKYSSINFSLVSIDIYCLSSY